VSSARHSLGRIAAALDEQVPRVTLVEKHATYLSKQGTSRRRACSPRDKERPGFAREWTARQQLLLWPRGARLYPATGVHLHCLWMHRNELLKMCGYS